MAIQLKDEVDGLVAKIGDKKDAQAALEGLAKLTGKGHADRQTLCCRRMGVLMQGWESVLRG